MGGARDTFEAITAAFNAHDIEAFGELIADDAVQTAPGDMRVEGKEAVKQFNAAWIQGFPDAKAEAHDLYEIGDVIVEEGTFSGTHNGTFPTPMGDIPPTGRPVRGEYVMVQRFVDGKCVWAHLMFDRLQLIEQLGLAPAPAAAG